MVNEFVLFSIAFFELTFLLILSRLRSDIIIGTIVINLIMISTFGALLVSVFGFETNIGNIFYASISIALYLLIERDGIEETQRAIMVAFALMVLFLVLSQLAINAQSVPATRTFADGLGTVFSLTPRIALGSLLAFLLSQHINIYLFHRLRELTKGRLIWLRVNVSNITAQVIDSVVFFLVAFSLTTSLNEVLVIMFTGFFIKVVFVFFATPFFYIDRFSKIVATRK